MISQIIACAIRDQSENREHKFTLRKHEVGHLYIDLWFKPRTCNLLVYNLWLMNSCRNLWWGVSHLVGVWVDKMMHLMLSNKHYSLSSTLIANINGFFSHAKLSSVYILDWNNLSLALFLAGIRFLTGKIREIFVSGIWRDIFLSHRKIWYLVTIPAYFDLSLLSLLTY